MRFLTWILIASVLLRGLIPAGYMPSAEKSGRIINIIICTGTGAQTIEVDENNQAVKQKPQKHSNHKATCPFALNTHSATPADSTMKLVISEGYTALFFIEPSDHPATATLRKTAPPRAPPIFS